MDLPPVQVDPVPAIHSLWSSWRGLGDGTTWVALSLLVAALMFRSVSDREPKAVPKKLPRIGKRGLADHVLRPQQHPEPIGDAVVDMFERHFAAVGTTGSFKTTLLALMLRGSLARGRRCVVITGGDSAQLEAEIRAAGGWVIRPKHSPLTFNVHEGEPSYYAQTWATLFPTSSQAKVYHSAFEICAYHYAERTPVQHRSLDGLTRFTLAYNPNDQEKQNRLFEGMKDGYVAIRLELLRLAFGEWYGNQLSINQAMRQGVPLMFVLDSADDPDLNRFAAAQVWQATNYAIRHTGHIDVFVDEVGRLPAELISDQVRTFRAADSFLRAGSHMFEDFTEIVLDLIGVWAIGRLTARAVKTRAQAHQLTWRLVPAENFGSHALEDPFYRVVPWLPWWHRRGHFWLVDDERVQQVHVPLYEAPPARPPRSLFPVVEGATLGPGLDHGQGGAIAATHKAVPGARNTDAPIPAGTPPVTVIREPDASTAADEPPGPPPEWLQTEIDELVLADRGGDAEQLQNVWQHQVVRRGHRLSTYHLQSRGRPIANYAGQEWVHPALMLALYERRPLREVRLRMAQKGPNGLTVDHRCRDPEFEGYDPLCTPAEEYRCCEVGHLFWRYRSGNTAVQWRRKAARDALPRPLPVTSSRATDQTSGAG